jgi:hypothetical protein
MFQSPTELTTKTPVKFSSSTEKIYNRIVSSSSVRQHSPTIRQHSPIHKPTITISSPSMVHVNSNKVYHPVSTMTTVHQPISALPSSISSTIRSPTITMPSPSIIRIEATKESTYEHDHVEVQRLQTMNDFLTENYTLVYGRLKELEA